MRNAAFLLLFVASPALGQDKDEPGKDDDFFGEDTPAEPKDEIKPESDKLQLGGMLYLRSNWSFTDSDDPADWPISLPNLVDVYLDAQPTDRVRGFVRGRLAWTPSVDSEDTSVASLVGNGGSDGTDVLLDELWLRFDIARAVFVTVGQQHVRWGASRIWNPVDVLNTVRRNSLEPFDVRTGIPILKLHVPVESLGWNFYAIGTMDRVNTIEKAGVAGRAEFVLGTAEVGLTAAGRDGVDPKVGFDLSAGVWDLDVTSEVGVTIPEDSDEGDPVVQVTGGVSYQWKYSDKDSMYLGAEYFYNQAGASSFNRDVFTNPLFTGESQFLYAGRHYVAGFVSLPAPGSLDLWTFTLSSLGNLSDRSALTRLDVSFTALTYLSVQMYAAVHYGKGGELHLGGDAFDAIAGAPDDLNPAKYPNQLVDVGLSLRIDL